MPFWSRSKIISDDRTQLGNCALAKPSGPISQAYPRRQISVGLLLSGRAGWLGGGQIVPNMSCCSISKRSCVPGCDNPVDLTARLAGIGVSGRYVHNPMGYVLASAGEQACEVMGVLPEASVREDQQARSEKDAVQGGARDLYGDAGLEKIIRAGHQVEGA